MRYQPPSILPSPAATRWPSVAVERRAPCHRDRRGGKGPIDERSGACDERRFGPSERRAAAPPRPLVAFDPPLAAVHAPLVAAPLEHAGVQPVGLRPHGSLAVARLPG